MIDGLVNEYSRLGKIPSTLDNYSLKELMELYLSYSKVKYFKEHNNMEDILNYISSYIMNNLSKSNFLEIMDLYTKLMIEVIDLERLIESTENIIRIRDYNLHDEFFIEFEANTFKTSKENFRDNYTKELNKFKEYDVLYNILLKLLDSFQKDILNYLNNYTEQLSVTEKDSLLKEINKKIEENSLEIIKRIELKQDKKKIELQSKFNEVPISELYNKLDISYLREQNYVYTNFQGVLNDLYKSSNKQ